MAYYRAVAQAAVSTPGRIGVMLVNLGTPDSPSYLAVQRYLRDFLGDRRVIDTSPFFWLPLLYGLVLPFRPIRTVRNYRKVWMQGGSPLAVYSKRLTKKIGERLGDAFGDQVRVELAMTYGNPSIAHVIQRLAEENVKRLLVLPLYPQYCSSTTAPVFDRTSRALARWRWLPETRFINDYYDDPGYIDALSAQIEKHWAGIGERSHLLFSYHGIPAVYVAEGDPYQAQALATTRLVRCCTAANTASRSRMVALLPVALRQRRLAAAVHGRHAEAPGVPRRAQAHRGLALVRRGLPRDARGGGHRIPRPIPRIGRRAPDARAGSERRRPPHRCAGRDPQEPPARLDLRPPPVLDSVTWIPPHAFPACSALLCCAARRHSPPR